MKQRPTWLKTLLIHQKRQKSTRAGSEHGYERAIKASNVRCRGVTWALVGLLEFCKRSYNSTEEETVSLGEWEGWAGWGGGDSTVGPEQAEEGSNTICGCFSHTFFMVYICYGWIQHCVMCTEVFRTQGEWKVGGEITTLWTLSLKQPFLRSVSLHGSAQIELFGNHSLQRHPHLPKTVCMHVCVGVCERETEHIMLSMYIVHACMWRLLLNMLVNACAGMTIRVIKVQYLGFRWWWWRKDHGSCQRWVTLNGRDVAGKSMSMTHTCRHTQDSGGEWKTVSL